MTWQSQNAYRNSRAYAPDEPEAGVWQRIAESLARKFRHLGRSPSEPRIVMSFTLLGEASDRKAVLPKAIDPLEGSALNERPPRAR
jgi:hypothetical protein